MQLCPVPLLPHAHIHTSTQRADQFELVDDPKQKMATKVHLEGEYPIKDPYMEGYHIRNLSNPNML